MSRFPPELWLYIAEFLSDEDIKALLGLNRLFYNLAMERRYNEVHLVESDPRKLFRKVILLNDHDASLRVKTLKVWPDAVWTALSVFAIMRTMRVWLPDTYGLSPLEKFVHRYFRARFTLQLVTVPEPDNLNMSEEEKATALTTLARNLTNVRDLHLKWDIARPQTQNPCCPLLDTFLPIIGSRLRSLTIEVPMSRVDPFAALAVVTGLEDLCITISDVPRARSGLVAAARTAQLINRFSGTLRSLSISTCVHFNLSPLFHNLHHFPQLNNLSLNIPLNLMQVPDTSGVNRLLTSHHNIEKLVVIDARCCAPEPVFQLVNSAESQYSQIFQGTSSANLTNVELGLHFPSFFTSPLNGYHVKSLLQSVSSLTIVRHCLTFSETRELLSSLPTEIGKLSLFLRDLTLPLFALLVQKCPNLKSLTLFAEKISLNETLIREWHATHLRCGVWGLQDLDIWTWEYRVGRRRQWHLMKTIAEYVPSLYSFAGQGHERVEPWVAGCNNVAAEMNAVQVVG